MGFHMFFHTLLALGYSMRTLWRWEAGLLLEDCWGWREWKLVPSCLYCLLELILTRSIPPARLKHFFPKNWHKPKQPGSMLAIKECEWSSGQCSNLFLSIVLFSGMERPEKSTQLRTRLPGVLQTFSLTDWDAGQHVTLVILYNIVCH